MEYNEKRQKDSIKFFEISDIYTNNKIEKKLSIIISGRLSNDLYGFGKKLDANFFINLLGVQIQDHIFEIDRSKLKSKSKNKIYAIEVNLKKIDLDFIEDDIDIDFHFNKYKEISEFPSTSRDISISLGDKDKLDELFKTIYSIKVDHLKDLFVFDFYSNNDLNITKIGFRFIFQSMNKTLEDSIVDKHMDIIFSKILKIESLSIPGLK